MNKTAIAFFLFASLVVFIDSPQAEPQHNPWYFNSREIAAAYRYQEKFGKGLRHPLPARRCLYGAKEFSTWYFEKYIALPCRFVTESLRHLREILESGAARYLFPLDLDHAHLAIPKSLWEKTYSRLPSESILPAMLKDRRMVALYHSAEHLSIQDSRTGKIDSAVREWQAKRNILGFYDGRPIVILPPHPEGQGVGVPEKYYGYGGFDFLASPHGRLAVLLENRAVIIDVTLQIGGSAPPHSAPVKSSNPLDVLQGSRNTSSPPVP